MAEPLTEDQRFDQAVADQESEIRGLLEAAGLGQEPLPLDPTKEGRRPADRSDAHIPISPDQDILGLARNPGVKIYDLMKEMAQRGMIKKEFDLSIHGPQAYADRVAWLYTSMPELGNAPPEIRAQLELSVRPLAIYDAQWNTPGVLSRRASNMIHQELGEKLSAMDREANEALRAAAATGVEDERRQHLLRGLTIKMRKLDTVVYPYLRRRETQLIQISDDGKEPKEWAHDFGGTAPPWMSEYGDENRLIDVPGVKEIVDIYGGEELQLARSAIAAEGYTRQQEAAAHASVGRMRRGFEDITGANVTSPTNLFSAAMGGILDIGEAISDLIGGGANAAARAIVSLDPYYGELFTSAMGPPQSMFEWQAMSVARGFSGAFKTAGMHLNDREKKQLALRIGAIGMYDPASMRYYAELASAPQIVEEVITDPAAKYYGERPWTQPIFEVLSGLGMFAGLGPPAPGPQSPEDAARAFIQPFATFLAQTTIDLPAFVAGFGGLKLLRAGANRAQANAWLRAYADDLAYLRESAAKMNSLSPEMRTAVVKKLRRKLQAMAEFRKTGKVPAEIRSSINSIDLDIARADQQLAETKAALEAYNRTWRRPTRHPIQRRVPKPERTVPEAVQARLKRYEWELQRITEWRRKLHDLKAGILSGDQIQMTYRTAMETFAESVDENIILEAAELYPWLGPELKSIGLKARLATRDIVETELGKMLADVEQAGYSASVPDMLTELRRRVNDSLRDFRRTESGWQGPRRTVGERAYPELRKRILNFARGMYNRTARSAAASLMRTMGPRNELAEFILREVTIMPDAEAAASLSTMISQIRALPHWTRKQAAILEKVLGYQSYFNPISGEKVWDAALMAPTIPSTLEIIRQAMTPWNWPRVWQRFRGRAPDQAFWGDIMRELPPDIRELYGSGRAGQNALRAAIAQGYWPELRGQYGAASQIVRSGVTLDSEFLMNQLINDNITWADYQQLSKIYDAMMAHNLMADIATQRMKRGLMSEETYWRNFGRYYPDRVPPGVRQRMNRMYGRESALAWEQFIPLKHDEFALAWDDLLTGKQRMTKVSGHEDPLRIRLEGGPVSGGEAATIGARGQPTGKTTEPVWERRRWLSTYVERPPKEKLRADPATGKEIIGEYTGGQLIPESMVKSVLHEMDADFTLESLNTFSKAQFMTLRRLLREKILTDVPELAKLVDEGTQLRVYGSNTFEAPVRHARRALNQDGFPLKYLKPEDNTLKAGEIERWQPTYTIEFFPTENARAVRRKELFEQTAEWRSEVRGRIGMRRPDIKFFEDLPEHHIEVKPPTRRFWNHWYGPGPVLEAYQESMTDIARYDMCQTVLASKDMVKTDNEIMAARRAAVAGIEAEIKQIDRTLTMAGRTEAEAIVDAKELLARREAAKKHLERIQGERPGLRDGWVLVDESFGNVGELKGKYVPAPLARQIKDFNKDVSRWVQGASLFLRMPRTALTALRLPTALRNIGGNVLKYSFVAQNWVANPANWKYYRAAAQSYYSRDSLYGLGVKNGWIEYSPWFYPEFQNEAGRILSQPGNFMQRARNALDYASGLPVTVGAPNASKIARMIYNDVDQFFRHATAIKCIYEFGMTPAEATRWVQNSYPTALLLPGAAHAIADILMPVATGELFGRFRWCDAEVSARNWLNQPHRSLAYEFMALAGKGIIAGSVGLTVEELGMMEGLVSRSRSPESGAPAHGERWGMTLGRGEYDGTILGMNGQWWVPNLIDDLTMKRMFYHGYEKWASGGTIIGLGRVPTVRLLNSLVYGVDPATGDPMPQGPQETIADRIAWGATRIFDELTWPLPFSIPVTDRSSIPLGESDYRRLRALGDAWLQGKEAPIDPHSGSPMRIGKALLRDVVGIGEYSADDIAAQVMNICDVDPQRYTLHNRSRAIARFRQAMDGQDYADAINALRTSTMDASEQTGLYRQYFSSLNTPWGNYAQARHAKMPLRNQILALSALGGFFPEEEYQKYYVPWFINVINGLRTYPGVEGRDMAVAGWPQNILVDWANAREYAHIQDIMEHAGIERRDVELPKTALYPADVTKALSDELLELVEYLKAPKKDQWLMGELREITNKTFPSQKPLDFRPDPATGFDIRFQQLMDAKLEEQRQYQELIYREGLDYLRARERASSSR